MHEDAVEHDVRFGGEVGDDLFGRRVRIIRRQRLDLGVASRETPAWSAALEG
jgi:hypothetical protein